MINPCSFHFHLTHPLALLIVLSLMLSQNPEIGTSYALKFEPYTLNGGLVSAVSGPDYVIVASDTRLSEGYEILTRNYLTSRIWSAVPIQNFGNGNGDDNGNNDDDDDVGINVDGSLSIPSKNGVIPRLTNENGSKVGTSSQTRDRNNNLAVIEKSSQVVNHHSPTFIASSGCASDCEALKRQIRLEINSHIHWNHGLTTLTPDGIANLLGQTLYFRRGFPFYSFCILAGISCDEGGGHGVVHTYDAIGSFERVAVATAGTGKEMLQPILDRLFAGTTVVDNDAIHTYDRVALQRDGRAVHASEQRIGLKLQPPVETCVSCTSDEAVAFLVKGYRSVAEREIAVGDSIVVCIVKRQPKNNSEADESQNNYPTADGNSCSMQVLRLPLKRH
jgi:20S proteasome subunit beta 6